MFGNPGVKDKIFKYHTIASFGGDASVLNITEDEKEMWEQYSLSNPDQYAKNQEKSHYVTKSL